MSIYKSRDLNLDGDAHRYDDLFVETPEVTTNPQEKKVKKSSPKQKYGKDGSYFDPETKRTYYKDPQYQKAYDDEWNRLEKLYRTRQEEQRRIERENFQRLLAQADALTKSMQALGIAPTPQPWEQKNRFDGYEDSKIERAPEDKVYITENSLTGKEEYIRGNGHPVSFDQQTGELVDAITDERTSFDTKLPQEIVITGKKRYNPVYMSSPSALIPLPGILSPSTEDYYKAADNTLSAFSPAAWADTAYDAMYTPDEINYPWDEGNKGLGSPVLDFSFDYATGLGLFKLANLSKFANALDNGINNTKRVTKTADFTKSNIDVKNFNFERSADDLLSLNNTSFKGIDDLISDINQMSNRSYYDKSGILRIADGILPEDMADYSILYKRFYDRLNSENLKTIHETPMYTRKNLEDIKIDNSLPRGSLFATDPQLPKDRLIQLDPEADLLNHWQIIGNPEDVVGSAALHEGAHSIFITDPELFKKLIQKYPKPEDIAKALGIQASPDDIAKYFDVNREDIENLFEYLFKDGGDEVVARGVEYKSIANTKSFNTEEELKSAMRTKAVLLDNEVTFLYYLIDKFGKWENLREFINEYSRIIGPAAAIGATQAMQSNN